jgi:hypothetical protein
MLPLTIIFFGWLQAQLDVILAHIRQAPSLPALASLDSVPPTPSRLVPCSASEETGSCPLWDGNEQSDSVQQLASQADQPAGNPTTAAGALSLPGMRSQPSVLSLASAHTAMEPTPELAHAQILSHRYQGESSKGISKTGQENLPEVQSTSRSDSASQVGAATARQLRVDTQRDALMSAPASVPDEQSPAAACQSLSQPFDHSDQTPSALAPSPSPLLRSVHLTANDNASTTSKLLEEHCTSEQQDC